MSRGRGHLVGAIFLIVGAALIAGAAYAWYATITRPLSWPRVEARVVSARVVNPGNPGQHKPEIVFELDDGRGPRRVTTVPSWSSSSYDAVRSYVDGYPAGARVDVAVNPSDAGDVRYELGPTPANLILPGILALMGTIFAVIGVATLLWRGRSGAAGSARTLRWVAALFVAIGVGIGGLGAWLWSRGTALDWPEVEATVVDRAVIAVSSTSTGSKRPSRPAYDIQVTFAYEVGDVRVVSRTTSGHSGTSRTGADARLQHYEPGSRHRIRHRPGDPNVIRFEVTAFRERALPGGLLLMGVVFFGFGVMFLRR